jgi:thiol-disulfide isomerase/thioredoxin
MMRTNYERFFRTEYLAFAALLALVFAGCDKVDEPYIENAPSTVDTSTSYTRKVLVEDFTGHTCGNCPRAAETAHTLEQLYGEQIVVVSVHMGFFAETKTNPDSSYAYDFTTAAGVAIDAQFAIDPTGLPKGMVNRKDVGGSPLLPYSGWGSEVAGIVVLDPDIKIEITNAYDELSRVLDITADITFLNSMNGTFNVVAILLEDSIVNWQKDYDATPGDIENYLHRHVLRGSISSTWGDQIAQGSVSSGTTTSSSYSMTLDNSWVDSKCSVVVYVYDAGSYEVIQAETLKVK